MNWAKEWKRAAQWHRLHAKRLIAVVDESDDKYRKLKSFIWVVGNLPPRQFYEEWHRLKTIERLAKDICILYPDRTSVALRELMKGKP